MENLSSAQPPEVNSNGFIDSLKNPKDPFHQHTKKELDSLMADPDRKAESTAFQQRLLYRIVSKDPSYHKINPSNTEDLRFCMGLASDLKMDQKEAVAKMLQDIESKLPQPKDPQRIPRRLFLAGAAATLAFAAAPRLLKDLSASAEKPATPTPKPTTTLAPTSSHTTQPTASPTASPEPTATKEPQKEINIFNELMTPFIQEALKRRQQRSKEDPEYSHRIDPELNKDRINFFVLVYGQTYEPPEELGTTIGSPTILSYNFKTQKMDMISLTHDIRAPEIEKFKTKTNQQTAAIKIDQVYFIGGFPLMQKTMEDATGLAGDFSLTIPDDVFKDAIDQVFADSKDGGIRVNIPFDLDTLEYYQDGKLQPKGHFDRGAQALTGDKALSFMKPIAQNYDPKTERNIRKGLLIDALINKLQESHTDPRFLLKLYNFLQNEKRVTFDFDTSSLLTNNLLGIARKIPMAVFDKLKGNSLFPKREKTLYVVDKGSGGDGGVHWVTASNNPTDQKDLTTRVYPKPYFAIPINGNPYSSDLVKDYWGSVRILVKEKLS